MGHFESNLWAMTEKQKRANGEFKMTEKQKLAQLPTENAQTKEYDFSAAESIFGGDDDTLVEPRRDEPTKH